MACRSPSVVMMTPPMLRRSPRSDHGSRSARVAGLRGQDALQHNHADGLAPGALPPKLLLPLWYLFWYPEDSLIQSTWLRCAHKGIVMATPLLLNPVVIESRHLRHQAALWRWLAHDTQTMSRDLQEHARQLRQMSQALCPCPPDTWGQCPTRALPACAHRVCRTALHTARRPFGDLSLARD